MVRIVVTNNQDFTPAQKRRLDQLGDVTYYDDLPNDADEYLQRVKGADVICSGTAGLKDAYAQLKDVYVTVSFVSVAFVDLEILKNNNVTLSNAPGANRHAVSEWIMAMTTLLMRDLYPAINRRETYRQGGQLPPITPGLAGKKMAILGHGNIGKRVAELAAAFGMDVTFFKRGGDLAGAVKDADVVVNALSSNSETRGLLDGSFFDSMKVASCFVTVTRDEIVIDEAMLRAVDSGHLRGAASDCGGILVGDTEDPLYQKLLDHPRMLVTPHISYNTEETQRVGNNIMIDNVEAWLKRQPQNVVV